MEELEIIARGNLPGMRLFLDAVEYRTAHFHTDWELLLVLEGQLNISAMQRDFQVSKDSVVILPPNLPHEFRSPTGNCTFLCVQLARDFLPGIENLNPEHYVVDDDADTAQIRADLLRCARVYLARQPFFELEVTELLSRVLRRIFLAVPTHAVSRDEARSMEIRNRRLLRLQAFVDENYRHKIRLVDFAKSEGCTVSFLSHFVRDCLNQTFQEYVTGVRFRSACQQMAAGNRKMLDVCMEAGFSDYRYFARAFRQYTGMTPEQFCRSGTACPDEGQARSLHSVERLYTPEESMAYLEGLRQVPQTARPQIDQTAENGADSKIV